MKIGFSLRKKIAFRMISKRLSFKKRELNTNNECCRDNVLDLFERKGSAKLITNNDWEKKHDWLNQSFEKKQRN
jgi:hypothetical protein